MITFFKQLQKSAPQNLKKRLIRDMLLVLLLTLLAIIFTGMYREQSTNDKVSSQLIAETSQLINNKFINYLIEFDTSLDILAHTAQTLDDGNVKKGLLEKVFSQAFQIHGDVTEVTIDYENGLTYRLTKTATSYEKHSLPVGNYSPLNQAEKNKDLEKYIQSGSIYWVESFSADNLESGLAASKIVQLPKSETHLTISYFIPAKNVINRVTDLDVNRNVYAVFFDKEGQIISRHAITTESVSERAGGKEEKLTSSDLAPIVQSWPEMVTEGQVTTKFRNNNLDWWAGFTPLGDRINYSSWLAVIVSEETIFEDIKQPWLKRLGAFGVILSISLFLTIYLGQKYSYMLKDLAQLQLTHSDLKASVQKLIKAGESTTLEFKSTMRYNLRTEKHGKEMEVAWLKTVTAYMNTDGGIILIGVNDEGEILGTDMDGFQNLDKCQLHFENLINNHLGAQFSQYIHLRFCNFDQKTIMVIECERVRKPVFLKTGKTEEFYIRTGPSSIKLNMSEMVSYLSDR